ncbi:response regulator [Stieleria sp. TO1_6]|uniref:ATP-binding response regulator n=1 Tax=Stieleria tagensis TaxID=2956795 RepID=UPI00209B81CE|nr:response regulator [Stieleria tagensis]MCO8121790.1 response regulator [Stieleria tagensis]
MPNILVVDDSATQSFLISRILQDQGNTVLNAANGIEALQVLQDNTVDLVVTDMQMPEMNGVQLIRKMRSTCPLIPAILVTAFGSEDLAAEALGTGAANYISKEHAGILLAETVRRVIRFVDANAESLDLKGALTRSKYEFIIDCDIERIDPLACLMVRLMATMNVLHTGDRIRMAEALRYLLFHSIVHCNLEEPVHTAPMSTADALTLVSAKHRDESARQLTDRIVTLRFDVNDRRAKFRVSHDGAGDSIRKAPLPGTPQSFADERGRGMLLLTSVMDEVRIDHNNASVTLVKYLAGSAAPHPA